MPGFLRHAVVNVPAMPKSAVRRKGSSELLAAALSHKGLFVIASLGYGKTTLVSEWAEILASEQEGSPEIVDAALRYVSLLGFAERSAEFLCEAMLASLADEGKNHPGFGCCEGEDPHGCLVDALRSMPEKTVICIDDCDLLAEDAIRVLEGLFLGTPSSVHWVLLCGEEPPFPLSRMLAAGMIAVAGEPDLAFTSEESSAFIRSLPGYAHPTEEEEAEICRLAEGWPLALRELGAHRAPNGDGVARLAHGPATPSLERIFEDALQPVPDDLRLFLVSSSVYNRLCAPACDAVYPCCLVGDSSSLPPESKPHLASQMLGEARRRHLFILRDGVGANWFHFHPLFRSYLRGKLREEPLISPTLAHESAGRWLCERASKDKFLDEAVRHYLLAFNWKQAARLIEKHWWQMLSLGRLEELVEWMCMFPHEQGRTFSQLRPMFMFASAMRWGGGGRKSAHLQYLDFSDYLEEDTLPPETTGASAMFDLLVDMDPNLHFDEEASIRRAEAGLAKLDDRDPLRAIHLISLACARLFRCEPEQAMDLLAQCKQASFVGCFAYASALAAYYEACLLIELGQLQRAAEACKAGRMQCEDVLSVWQASSPALGMLDIVEGKIALMQNDVERARRLIRSGCSDVDSYLPHIRVDALEALFDLGLAEGNRDAALRCASRLRREAPGYSFLADAMESRCRLEFDGAPFKEAPGAALLTKLSEKRRLPTMGPYGGARCYHRACLLHARCSDSPGSAEKALVYLDRQLALSEDAGLKGRVLEVQVERALLLDALGKRKMAAEAMFNALRIALPEGNVRAFAGCGRSHDLMLRSARTQETRRFADLVSSAFGFESDAREGLEMKGGREARPRPVALTQREMQVLELVSEGLSNKQIARELKTETCTVKAHMTHIMRKLGVESRTQAAARYGDLA